MIQFHSSLYLDDIITFGQWFFKLDHVDREILIIKFPYAPLLEDPCLHCLLS
jgi:hypothetical protein